MLNFGLAGNPNCGKTTLFNVLTGSTAHVGNWAGVTVDRKEGFCTTPSGNKVCIIDLPGIYSLSPYTPEEIIARNYIYEETPDLIINIVDATNIERNLYLTTQLLEMDCPVIIALNMMDMVTKNGDHIDVKGLSKLLGVPIVPISATKKEGLNELMNWAVEIVTRKRKGYSVLSQTHIAWAMEQIQNEINSVSNKHTVFDAVKVLENDKVAIKKYNGKIDENKINKIRDKVVSNDKYGDLEAIVADLRYKFITEKCGKYIVRNSSDEDLTPSEKVDQLLTHKYLGIPIFFIFMFLVFHFTFSESLFGIRGLPSPGVFLQGISEGIMDALRGGITTAFYNMGVADWLYGLVIDGIIGGVGSVLSFVPQILCLFLFLSILEDSGYMARAAFIMDKALRSFGLSGRAFLPLLMGFGCSVPAIMASRTLERERDRRATILLVPFMSCGAKLPIYSLFAAALFARNSDIIIFLMYFIGIITAIICALILKKTVLKDDEAPFIMELPPYHRPSSKSISRLLWEKLKDYVIRAGTVILASTIIIWFLSNFSLSLRIVDTNSGESILGVLGNFMTPFFKPLGFVSGTNAWKPIVAILTGLIAKEAVVSTLGVLYNPVGIGIIDAGAEKTALLTTIASTFTPAAALSFMTFNLLCIPCIAAVSAMRSEMKSGKWFTASIVFWLGVAWIVSFIVYNIAVIFI